MPFRVQLWRTQSATTRISVLACRILTASGLTLQCAFTLQGTAFISQHLPLPIGSGAGGGRCLRWLQTSSSVMLPTHLQSLHTCGSVRVRTRAPRLTAARGNSGTRQLRRKYGVLRRHLLTRQPCMPEPCAVQVCRRRFLAEGQGAHAIILLLHPARRQHPQWPGAPPPLLLRFLFCHCHPLHHECVL